MMRRLWGVVFVCWLAACGEDAPPTSENYGNLLESPAGLILVAEEHPSGWGRADCFACHPPHKLHLVNRTGIPDLDLTFIRQVVANQGEASCSACHGDNGVGR
ncbi:MAG: hypothetical protein N3C12_01820 [Candidatus Binatia bacterium]|nr:hypothetical protein [Candidatus Binatia bacterium]